MSARELVESELGYGGEIVEEAESEGLDVALAAAIVQKESGGRNIFGCDHGAVGDFPPYCHQEVTAARVKLLLDSPYENGVGLTQLTYTPFIRQAEAMGGAHVPRYQCRVAFRLMAEMLSKYSYDKALAAYNAGEEDWLLGIENGYAQDLSAKHSWWQEYLMEETPPVTGGGEVVTPQDIIASAYKLEGVFYRIWRLGNALPMWTMDGYAENVAPPVSHMREVGVMCSDLVNYALVDNGLPPGYGTEAFAHYLLNQVPFDPNTPGVPGAICLSPYRGPALAEQGHIGIYVDEHTIIQAISSEGVTDSYTDAETYGWGGSTRFTHYGFLPGVDYSAVGGGGGGSEPELYELYGWYDYQSADSWNLRYHPPTV